MANVSIDDQTIYADSANLTDRIPAGQGDGQNHTVSVEQILGLGVLNFGNTYIGPTQPTDPAILYWFQTIVLASIKAITAFSLGGFAGSIDESAKTILVNVPFATDITALVATFTTTGVTVKVGDATQASEVTSNDFTAPVGYTVIAEDASTATYTVTVAVAEAAGAPWTGIDNFDDSFLNTSRFTALTAGAGTVVETGQLTLVSPADADATMLVLNMPIEKRSAAYTVKFNMTGFAGLHLMKLVQSPGIPASLPLDDTAICSYVSHQGGADSFAPAYQTPTGWAAPNLTPPGTDQLMHPGVDYFITLETSITGVRYILKDASNTVISTSDWINWTDMHDTSNPVYLGILGDNYTSTWNGTITITSFEVA